MVIIFALVMHMVIFPLFLGLVDASWEVRCYRVSSCDKCHPGEKCVKGAPCGGGLS